MENEVEKRTKAQLLQELEVSKVHLRDSKDELKGVNSKLLDTEQQLANYVHKVAKLDRKFTQLRYSILTAMAMRGIEKYPNVMYGPDGQPIDESTSDENLFRFLLELAEVETDVPF